MDRNKAELTQNYLAEIKRLLEITGEDLETKLNRLDSILAEARSIVSNYVLK